MSTLPPLIPREDIFGNPDKISPEVSPDGTKLAYIAPDAGVLNVWLRTVGQSDDRAVTRDRKRGIRMFTWAHDERHLLYIQDLDGDENWHIWSVDLQGDEIRDLTPHAGVQAQLVGVDSRFPNEVLLSMNLRDARVHDVYRADLATGELTLEVENPGDVVGWLADADFKVRGAHAGMPDGGFQLRVRDTVDAPWRPLVTWGPDDDGGPTAFTEDGKSIYLSTSIGSDTQELRVASLADGSEQVLATHPVADLSGMLMHPVEHVVRAVSFAVDRAEWCILDQAVADDVRRIHDLHPGDASVVSMDLADRTWVIHYDRDDAPASYHVYDRQTRELTYLFTAREKLQNVTLAEMQPVKIVSRDGLDLYSYLTLPPGIEARNLPLVLNVHGGPWARDHWGYDPEAQWFANRGYACLQVNFRGSTGFGKRFLHAGDREWGGKMHDDLIDAVNWAIAEGIADPKRVAIYGGSYGGYSALVGAAFTPEVFTCSVDIVGPSSIRTLIASIPPYWEPLRSIFIHRVGDPETEAEFLDSRSPLYKADQIVCPMLIAQGANDPRVKQAESEAIVAALRERGKEVEYLLFEDEGHGFARPENRLKFYAAAEKFLARHLGGRCED